MALTGPGKLRDCHMTLIACFHPHQCRTLIADVLISSPVVAADVALPTRAYIAPDEFRRMDLKPAEFRRKVIQISSDLVALWSGDYPAAKSFAERARDWFRDLPVNEEMLVKFCDAHYRQPATDFQAIMVQSNTNRFCMIGDVYRSSSLFAGEYAVAGSGCAIFRDIVDRMLPHEDGIVAPDVAGLQIANDLMAREIVTGQTYRSQFGGAYEILYRGLNGFERVDDVMHAFALVKVSTTIEISHYSYVSRQWYENEQLCITSQVTDVGQQQGLGYLGVAVPGILGEKVQSARTTEFLLTRPNYLCIHHLFEIEGKEVSHTLTMRADAIDQFFSFSEDGSRVTFEGKATYSTLLHETATKIKNQLNRGSAQTR